MRSIKLGIGNTMFSMPREGLLVDAWNLELSVNVGHLNGRGVCGFSNTKAFFNTCFPDLGTK